MMGILVLVGLVVNVMSGVVPTRALSSAETGLGKAPAGSRLKYPPGAVELPWPVYVDGGVTRSAG